MYHWCDRAVRTHREDFQRIATQIVTVPALHIVYAHKQTIIHDMDLLQELQVNSQLFRQKCALLGTKLELSVSVDPVKIFQYCARVLSGFLFWVQSANCATLEIVCLVDIAMRRKEVVHYDKVDFPPSWKFHTVEPVETGE